MSSSTDTLCQHFVFPRVDHPLKVHVYFHNVVTYLYSFLPRTCHEWNRLPASLVTIRDRSFPQSTNKHILNLHQSASLRHLRFSVDFQMMIAIIQRCTVFCFITFYSVSCHCDSRDFFFFVQLPVSFLYLYLCTKIHHWISLV